MNGTNPVDRRITWAVAYLQRHLAEAVPIPALAARVNLSPSRFRQLFRAQLGLGPAQYQQRLRLRRARLLIERTFLTVKEVMALVGYNDPSHFARDFRRLHGVAPSALRERGVTASLPAEPGSSLKRQPIGESKPARAMQDGAAPNVKGGTTVSVLEPFETQEPSNDETSRTRNIAIVHDRDSLADSRRGAGESAKPAQHPRHR